MADEIKKLKFKQNAPLQIEVVPLDSLTKVNKAHLITPHRTNFYHVFLFDNCQPTHYVDFEKIIKWLIKEKEQVINRLLFFLLNK